MKAPVFALLVCLFGAGYSEAQGTPFLDAPKPQPGIIVGTVVDLNNDPIPGATVVLQGPTLEGTRTAAANENGFFEFKDLEPERAYQIAISAEGFANWNSSDVILSPGQYVILSI